MCAQAIDQPRPTPNADPWEAGADRNEPTWVARAASGDEAAFERLVRRYHDHVWRLLRRILQSDQEAEGATQETFVAAWAALPEYPGQPTFSIWLRRAAVVRALSGAVPRRGGVGTPILLPRRRDRPTLEAGFKRLDISLRAPIALQLEGLDHDAIAEDLGVPPATVRSRIAAAREALLRRLADKRSIHDV